MTLTCTAQDGTSRASTFTVKMPALKGEEEERLTVTAGESNAPFADNPLLVRGGHMPYGLMPVACSCRWAVGDVCADIGGANYVSYSVKQVSGWLT